MKLPFGRSAHSRQLTFVYTMVQTPCSTCWQVDETTNVVQASSYGWEGQGTSNWQTSQTWCSSFHNAINIWPKGTEFVVVINVKMVRWTNTGTKPSVQKVDRIITANCFYYLSFGPKLGTVTLAEIHYVWIWRLFVTQAKLLGLNFRIRVLCLLQAYAIYIYDCNGLWSFKHK